GDGAQAVRQRRQVAGDVRHLRGQQRVADRAAQGRGQLRGERVEVGGQGGQQARDGGVRQRRLEELLRVAQRQAGHGVHGPGERVEAVADGPQRALQVGPHAGEQRRGVRARRGPQRGGEGGQVAPGDVQAARQLREDRVQHLRGGRRRRGQAVEAARDGV